MDSRPIVPRGRHPIETGKYKLPTRAIEEVTNVIYQWVENRLPGGVIYGNPRIGKTSAIQFLLPRIKEYFGSPIPAFLVTCEDQVRASPNDFYENMLISINHGLATGGTAAAKKKRITTFLADEVTSAGEYRVILFLDDAQWLKEVEYNWLMGIHNKLNSYEIELITILVGQRELLAKRSMFTRSNGMQIVGRFMTCRYQFHGIRDLIDVQTALRGYDDLSSSFPIGSDWPLLRYWIPEAFENGFRLEHQALTITQGLDEMKRDMGIKELDEIPMQSFVAFTSTLIRDLADKDGSSLELTLSDVLEALNLYS